MENGTFLHEPGLLHAYLRQPQADEARERHVDKQCSGGENLSEEKEGETIHLQPHKRTVDARGGEHGGDVSEQQCLIPQLLSEIRYRLDLSGTPSEFPDTFQWS